MFNAISHLPSKSASGRFMWHRIEPYLPTLFDEPDCPSMDQAIILASPHAVWTDPSYTQNSVARWAAAALTIPYSEEVGRNVVDALLKIAYVHSLRPHIPIEIWAWLKRRPFLPPVCKGRYWGTTSHIVDHIRNLGDVEILKSYFLLVWSEWDFLHPSGWAEAQISIKEDFSEIGMWRHREELIKHLDHVLEQLERGLEYFQQHKPEFDEGYIQRRSGEYGQLKKVLLRVDRKAMKQLFRTSPG